MVVKYFLGGLILLPPGLHSLGYGSSYAFGLTLLVALFLAIEVLSSRPTISRVAVVVLIYTTVALPLHLLFVGLMNEFSTILWARAILTLMAINLVIVATDMIARNALKISADAFDRIIKQLTFLLIALGFLSVLTDDIARIALGRNSSIPPFSEPSHFTLALAPFAIYGLASRNLKITVLGLIFIPFMILEVRSSIFIVLIILLSLVTVSRWILPFVMIGSVFVYFESISELQSILARYNLQYYIDRISFTDSDNLSVLVYQQGIDLIKSTFSGDRLMGLGFQQLGATNLELESTYRISDILGGGESNIKDGSFLAAKLFGEFGIFAVVLLSLLSVTIIHAFNNIQRHYSRDYLAPQMLFAYCCIYGYVIEIFFRGIGYFSIGTALFFFSLFLLGRTKRAQRSQSGPLS